MNKIFLFLIVASFSINLSFAGVPTKPKAAYVNSQTVRQWQAQKKEIVLVDVREKKEFDAGHIEGAISIPYHQVEKRIQEFKKADKPAYIFYCTYSAWRAPYAANVLADYGYQNTYVLEGGVSAWNAGGQVIYATNVAEKPYIAPYSKNDPKLLDHPKDKVYEQKIKLTLEELSHYDGQDGRPAYVAVAGVIYDLTQSRLWRGGVHAPSKGKAFAGRDLTEVLKDSPHGDKHLKDFPIVGYLKEEKKIEVNNKICPVSREEIDLAAKKHQQVEYQGKIYNLCCRMCVKDFNKEPAKYAKIADEDMARKN